MLVVEDILSTSIDTASKMMFRVFYVWSYLAYNNALNLCFSSWDLFSFTVYERKLIDIWGVIKG